ncbi:MAG: hypothetical protein ACRC7O_14965 [Fimbriiglobus sp.]
MFPSRVIRSAAAPILVALTGCDGPPRAATTTPTTAPARAAAKLDPAPTAIPRPGPPKPDATRLRYDAASRTLEVYSPPVPGGRWMLTTPHEPRGIPLDGPYQFPPTVNPDITAVFYVANGKPSEPVSLREILEAKDFPSKH